MSRKRECDRCGKQEEEGIIALPSGWGVVTVSTGAISTLNDDLCGECVRDLRQWLRKAPPEYIHGGRAS